MAYRDYSGGQSPNKTTGNILNKHKDGMPADAVYVGRGSTIQRAAAWAFTQLI